MRRIRLMEIVVFVGAILGLALIAPQEVRACGGSVLCVDKDAPGPTYNGLSWTTAFTTVQAALDWTRAHTATPYEIWVAEGVYYPDEGGSHIPNSITETFRIAHTTQLYGGFAATETLRAQRDWGAHPTVLSGDIDANDRNTDANYITEVYTDVVGENSLRVIYLDGVTYQAITETTVLDGFIITAGDGYDKDGGGVYCNGHGKGGVCSPTLAHLIICGNKSESAGGGMCNDAAEGGLSSPVLTDVTFSYNYSLNGGGMCNDAVKDGISYPTLSNVTFTGNVAYWNGGGMTNFGGDGGICNPDLGHVTFRDNRAGLSGGGMFNSGDSGGESSPILTHVIFESNWAGVDGGGGMSSQGYYDGGISNPSLTHVTFSGNRTAGYGGGMQILVYENGISAPVLTHVTFNGNQAAYGGGMYNDGNSVLINVLFSGNKVIGDGGGMYNDGNPVLINVLFSGNKGIGDGGGMFNDVFDDRKSQPTLVNVTFSGNHAGGFGGGLNNAGQEGTSGSPTLINCILWGNTATTGTQIYNDGPVTPTITYSTLEWASGVYTGVGNLNRDPQFVAPITAAAAPTTTGDYHLRPTSPAIDAGANFSVTVAADLDGQPRIAGRAVDMGAYESPRVSVYLPLIIRTYF